MRLLTGVAALTAAYELTRTPALRGQYDITVYQMGWRLGGKGASGRNRNMCDRIQEHGIHLWMGFYENAFHLIRQGHIGHHVADCGKGCHGWSISRISPKVSAQTAATEARASANPASRQSQSS